MRPTLLYPLFTPITEFKGVGRAKGPLIERLIGGSHAIDLLWHWPTGRTDRRAAPPLGEAVDGMIISPLVTVLQHRPPSDGFTRRSRNMGSRSPYRVVVSDASGTMTLVWFHGSADWITAMLPDGSQRIVSGKIERRDGHLQMLHPDHVVVESDGDTVRRVEPTYPLTAGIFPKVLSGLIRQALSCVPKPESTPNPWPEWLDPALQQRHGWPDWVTAIHTVHAPQDAEDLERSHPARQRLIYDELLAGRLALALTRRAMRAVAGRATQGDGHLRVAVRAALPFAPTRAQDRALAEIEQDLTASTRMLRLLQGDVGSGKTLVAILTLLCAVESGRQGVLMAPTELVARQHADSLEEICGPLGVRIVLLTGRDKGKKRTVLTDQLADGTAQIAVGTHALFQDDVRFHDLAIAVVDEQHRFGVHQRLALSEKGRGVDVLVMTATPIPRTLTLTHYGDMAVSRLDEKPPGRQPITTVAMPQGRLDDVVAGVERALAKQAQIYWVCPLVEDAEPGPDQPPLTSAEDRAARLSAHFGPERVGLIHGRMKAADKDSVMERFASGALSILVATTVIEVGVNVPAATVMVIEHAERFGLAQLHQLRGRIGRGSEASHCVLLYRPPLGKIAKARLDLLRHSEDGFEIAEKDLELRGGGEVLGVRQSGLPGFRLADAMADTDLLEIATADAKHIVAMDPELQTPRGEALRVLLYLFERDAAVKTLKAG